MFYKQVCDLVIHLLSHSLGYDHLPVSLKSSNAYTNQVQRFQWLVGSLILAQKYQTSCKQYIQSRPAYSKRSEHKTLRPVNFQRGQLSYFIDNVNHLNFERIYIFFFTLQKKIILTSS